MPDSLNPIDLVEGLHRLDEDARNQLRQLCLRSIECLVDHIMVHQCAKVERNIVIDRTIRWIEMYLRSRSATSFNGMDNQEFLALILMSAYQMLTPPELDWPQDTVAAMPERLQCPNGYQV
jgi:hypothetical protein